MINFRIGIDNPWAKNDFKNIYYTDGNLTERKGWEFQIIKHSHSLFEIHFSYTVRGTDHAGLTLSFALLGYCASLNVYDSRHWDYENDCWEKYDDVSSTTQD